MCNTAIFIGTVLQQKIFKALERKFIDKTSFSSPLAVLLEDYYKFGISLVDYKPKLTLKCLFKKPWYDLSLIFKALALIPYSIQILSLAYRYDQFIFFVDTGLLERTAIKILNCLYRRTIVIQDALKRIPKERNTKALTWFGGAKASCYLLTGIRYASMVTNGKFKVVGSPIYENTIKNIPLGKKILFINQCFAKYGEMHWGEEVAFMEQVVKAAMIYGQVELRLHPHNDISLYDHLKQIGIEVSQEKKLSLSLEEAGVVVGVNSTVLLEAMTMMRPVLIMHWHPSPFENPFATGVIHCAKIEDMNCALKEWRDKRRLAMPLLYHYKNEIRSHIACSGQQSIDRIFENIF